MSNATALRRLGVALLVATGLSLIPMGTAHADPECYEVERLPGECLSLATYTYITGLHEFRDHLIGEVLDERTQKQAAQAEASALRQEVFEAQSRVAARNQRISILRAKLDWRKQVIRRLWHTIERLT